jgi:hypothetical protein
MHIARTKLLYLMVGITLGHLLMGALPLAAQADCKVILDAEDKALNTSSHQYVTGTTGATKVSSELIYAAGNIYMLINGKWISSGTTKDVEQLMQKNLQNPKASKPVCSHLKDELVNGELAGVYTSSEVVASGSMVSTQIWISKTKGLPLRQDVDVDLGTGKAKTHNSTRFEYGNIKPPI